MEHYFTRKPTSPMRSATIKARLLGNDLQFHTGSGIFSTSRIDPGTAILIESCVILANSKILDLGCGYGPIGISIAKVHTDCQIVMTDINERAVALAKKNIALNNAVNASAVHGNMFERVHGEFDSILLNPPMNAGRKICFEMIQKSKEHLAQRGLLQIVARRNKGGEMLAEKMKSVFGNVYVAAKKSGYWVYVSKNL